MIINDKKIEISKEQAEEILGGDFAATMRMGELTVRCNNCGPFGPTTDMTTDRYMLGDLYDVILEGICNNCHARIARYFETGDNEESKKIAIKIWSDR